MFAGSCGRKPIPLKPPVTIASLSPGGINEFNELDEFNGSFTIRLLAVSVASNV